ncbi:MAG TPA: hypothetical protein VMC08_09860 [Bacteroidales bacterium]|nr:hypothetical protein [Bacteroidales bacterium]
MAKKGASGKRQEHFAHYHTEPCLHAYETSLHFSAKQLLEKEKSIALPYRKKSFNSLIPGKLFQELPLGEHPGVTETRLYSLDNIRSEKKLHEIVPDIRATVDGREVLIEIAVTHKVRQQKAEQILKIGIPLLEVDLSYLDHDVEEEEIREALLGTSANKKWIFNPREDHTVAVMNGHRTELQQSVRELATPVRKQGKQNNPTINCPDPLRYSHKLDLFTCRQCIYHLTENPYHVFCGVLKYPEIRQLIDRKNREILNG